MSDDCSGSFRVGVLARVGRKLFGKPVDRDDLLEQVREAHDQHVVDNETLNMVEGVFRIGDTQVREVMVPRSKMVVLDREDGLETMLNRAIESAHSRFPVIGDDRDEVVGIVLAKDLLPYLRKKAEELVLRDILREVTFVPESKRLNTMLQDFRRNRNHMAIVVDEYGGVAGLVTIEDVIEEIVGEIEDEHDPDEEVFIEPLSGGGHRVDALTTIDEFNEFFACELDGSEFETIGGMVAQAFGRVPKGGDEITFQGFTFRVLKSDERRIDTLGVNPA
ncbi:MAG: magnesium/cobalt efflux protein [Gammaproteobacteria bacterium]|nr:MAG: magnesium/cobalt efflux protein [Gammaproteobacteria bacterium]RLA14494.1 MAG: magnesium/cobalt efflux protein [Gammaproteobacteria bacterium]RLA16757.1 MAG: magnesium/cobalt efflux protein [Gammaproteobacteria bacterium]